MESRAARDMLSSSERADLATSFFRTTVVMEHTVMADKPNISRGEMGVLGTLSYEQDGLAPSELARRLKVSPARIANTLRSLEKKGFITREINPEDRRGIVVHTTEAGSAYARANLVSAVGHIEEIFDALTPDESRELIRLMDKIEGMLCERGGIDSPPLEHINEAVIEADDGEVRTS